MELVDTSFAAMGSHARLFVCDGPPDLESVLRARLEQLEQRWSRFIDSSEVCDVNSRCGSPVVVSADTMLLFQRALTASRLTRGWFDPTLLRELEAAGYDKPFLQLEAAGLEALVLTIDRSSANQSVQIHEWGSPCRLIEMDTHASTITMPSGVSFDPGGLGKGLAADLLLEQALQSGATAALIDLGGDIVTGGQAPPQGWPIDIEDPFDLDNVALRIRIPWGAVATSSRAKRSWHSNGARQHHLIDAQTGAPSTSDVVAVTVVAGAAWQAEAFAKAALLTGAELGLELLKTAGLDGMIIDQGGDHYLTEGMASVVVEEPT